ncbi:MAG: hypothetical protein M1823_003377 [Watsoniomyces obsoletus]|nr:MAG: hypothetical protein M1823_003377 [Watsoniomyces obsoletus]
MANLSTFRRVLVLALPVLSSTLIQAATVTYDFNITWVTADPTGTFPRPVIGINGRWPIPTVECSVGDRLIVNVNNQLGNQSTSLHWHGMFQNGTAEMDGAAGVTQCGIPPGGSFQYNFTVNQPGTYWYHSHDRGQYPDGLRGAFIVHDPENPHKDRFDEEMVLTVSDWYNEQMRPLIARFLDVSNPTGAEPVPERALMNDTVNLKVAVEPRKTYLIHIINVGAFSNHYLWFENHTMSIVEVDGVYTEPAEAESIYVTPAQRYSVLLTTKDTRDQNFAIVGSMDQDLFDKIPEGLNPNATGWLVYDDQKPLPEPTPAEEFNPFDDYTLIPFDRQPIYDKVDQSVTLDMAMDNLGDGVNYAFFNDITYVRPKVPTLYTALTSGANSTDTQIYGANTHAVVLKKNEIVEIILNNLDPGKHPFHLHGHNFQTVYRSEDEAGAFDKTNTSIRMPEFPMKRDTVLVRPFGNIVLRFQADNPDIRSANCVIRVWLFHCHVEWHLVSGLVMTFVEAPVELQQQNLSIPRDHLKVCEDQGIPSRGNAAGNQQNLLDLTGAFTSPDPLPEGFTTRGIVALVFSILSAFIGIGVIAWYGFLDLSSGAATAVASEKVAGT